MSPEYMRHIAEILEGFGSFLTVLVTIYIALLVQNYTAKRDRLDVVRRKWEEVQTVNIAVLSHEENIAAFEQIVYGDDFKPNNRTSRKYFFLFIMINGMQHLFFAYKNGIISKQELLYHAKPTASLLKRQESLIVYLLNERGYSDDFAVFVKRILAQAHPSEPPNAARSSG